MSARLHGLPPVIGRRTRLLVLGSFPGLASLQAQQYYAHPRNHFWPIVGAVWGLDLVAMPYAQRLIEAKKRGLGLWDAYASCRRQGSLDQAIEDAEFNDLLGLRKAAPQLNWVLHNGGESARVASHVRALGFQSLRLPSTSPANASWSFEAKRAAWQAAFSTAGILGMTSKNSIELPPASLSEADGVRYLHLGSIWVQGAMQINKPHKLVLEYVQRMLAALLWLPTDALGQGHAVQLGLGAGAITRFTAQQLRMATTAVEINPQVITANELYFKLPREAEVVHGDAADWLAQAEAGSVTLLHVDLYDHEAAAPVLDSPDFYAACRQVLTEGGVMSVNLFGRKASFEASVARIADAFGPEQVWSLRATREGNTVVVAGRSVVVPDRETLSARAVQIEKRFGALGLPAQKWLRMVRPYQAATAPQEGP